MGNITVPKSITESLKQRQQVLTQINHEIQLILNTYMATVEGDKVYQLSEDLTELVEVMQEELIEEEKENG